MKTRPIIFSGPMIRALLAGTKTQTRRVVKCPRLDFVAGCGADRNSPKNYGYECDDGWVKLQASADPRDDEVQLPCPYGVPGDRLWVRETVKRDIDPRGDSTHSCYAADESFTVADAWPWKNDVLPSIHCPRGLSRITLEIVSVRVERLQEISEGDSRAEGITDGGCLACGNCEPCGCWFPVPAARESYVRLWESINGHGSWSANPWVWVIEFRRVEQ